MSLRERMSLSELSPSYFLHLCSVILYFPLTITYVIPVLTCTILLMYSRLHIRSINNRNTVLQRERKR